MTEAAGIRELAQHIALQCTAFTAAAAHDEALARQGQKLQAASADFLAGVDSTAIDVSDAEVRHRLRNELNRIAGPCQLLMMRVSDGAARALLDDIAAGVARTLELLQGTARPAPDGAAPPLRATTPGRIIVAEDDAGNRDFLVEVLSAAAHEVATVGDGDAALQLVERGDFDLLLLDLGLPQMNGIEVLRRLQEGGWQLPVIVVTGQGGVDEAVRCIEHGADDFLTKPIQIEILRARVASCIEKARLREREFGQFFPPKLARSFARRPSLITDLPGKHAEVSVLFCDLRHFTAISEKLGPAQTTRWLRGVMSVLAECVTENEGVLVDFAGDELMAMWGAPDDVPDHATRACNTAVAMLRCLPALSREWAPVTGAPTEIAIGVNSGRALVGHVGTPRKTKYGPLGDAVNIGSRVAGATQYLRTPLLVTEATRRALDEDWTAGDVRRLCRVQVKNVARAVELHEIRASAEPAADAALFSGYEAALGDYENGAFEQAAATLGQLLVDYPDDGPSLMLMARVVDALLRDDQDFDPIWRLENK